MICKSERSLAMIFQASLFVIDSFIVLFFSWETNRGGMRRGSALCCCYNFLLEHSSYFNGTSRNTTSILCILMTVCLSTNILTSHIGPQHSKKIRKFKFKGLKAYEIGDVCATCKFPWKTTKSRKPVLLLIDYIRKHKIWDSDKTSGICKSVCIYRCIYIATE